MSSHTAYHPALRVPFGILKTLRPYNPYGSLSFMASRASLLVAKYFFIVFGFYWFAQQRYEELFSFSKFIRNYFLARE